MTAYPGRSAAGLPDDPSRVASTVRSIRAVAVRRRRLLAALCAGAAVLVAVSAMTPAPAASEAPDGHQAADGALAAAAGSLAADVAERVAVAVRLADPAGLLLLRVGAHAEVIAGPRSDPGLPVGSGAVASGSAADSEVLAPDAVVLALPGAPGTFPAGDDGSGGSGGSLLNDLGGSGTGVGSLGTTRGLDGVVLVAVPPSDARRLAAAAGTRALSVAVGLPSTG